uniref:Uncharacterized protein n=1 Tax=Glossina pallidipes TaxID=7398 RepID=A0A1A9ZYC0_GLOPL
MSIINFWRNLHISIFIGFIAIYGLTQAKVEVRKKSNNSIFVSRTSIEMNSTTNPKPRSRVSKLLLGSPNDNDKEYDIVEDKVLRLCEELENESRKLLFDTKSTFVAGMIKEYSLSEGSNKLVARKD